MAGSCEQGDMTNVNSTSLGPLVQQAVLEAKAVNLVL
jgi:hypothetical protein